MTSVWWSQSLCGLRRSGDVCRSRVVELKVRSPQVFEEPAQHPYTQGLFRSIPRLGHAGERLETIEGAVPNPLHFPPGCKFHDRCPEAAEQCRKTEPTLEPKVEEGHLIACHERKPLAAGAESTGDGSR